MAGLKSRQDERTRAFTLIEVMVVLFIIVLLFSGSIAAYQRMNTQQKLNGAISGIVTILQKARSTAINRNQIVHVRVRTWDPNVLPPALYTEESIAVQVYPNAADALRVTGTVQTDDNSSTNAWSPYNSLLNPTSTPPNQPYLNSLTGTVYNNIRLDYYPLPEPLHFGVQEADTATPANAVLSFMPDGSASTTLTLFVTDYETVDGTEVADLKDTRFAAANDKRAEVLTRIPRDPRIKQIRVFQGGMIKVLD